MYSKCDAVSLDQIQNKVSVFEWINGSDQNPVLSDDSSFGFGFVTANKTMSIFFCLASSCNFPTCPSWLGQAATQAPLTNK